MLEQQVGIGGRFTAWRDDGEHTVEKGFAGDGLLIEKRTAIHGPGGGVNFYPGYNLGAGGDKMLEKFVRDNSQSFVKFAGPEGICGAALQNTGDIGGGLSFGRHLHVERIFLKHNLVVYDEISSCDGLFLFRLRHRDALSGIPLKALQHRRASDPGKATCEGADRESQKLCFHDLDTAGVACLFFVFAFAFDVAEKQFGLGRKSVLTAAVGTVFKMPAGGLQEHAFEAAAGDDRKVGDALPHDGQIDHIDAGAAADVERGAGVEGEKVFTHWKIGS